MNYYALYDCARNAPRQDLLHRVGDTLDGIDISARSSGLVNPRWEVIVHQVDNMSEVRTLISNE